MANLLSWVCCCCCCFFGWLHVVSLCSREQEIIGIHFIVPLTNPYVIICLGCCFVYKASLCRNVQSMIVNLGLIFITSKDHFSDSESLWTLFFVFSIYMSSLKFRISFTGALSVKWLFFVVVAFFHAVHKETFGNRWEVLDIWYFVISNLLIGVLYCRSMFSAFAICGCCID